MEEKFSNFDSEARPTNQIRLATVFSFFVLSSVLNFVPGLNLSWWAPAWLAIWIVQQLIFILINKALGSVRASNNITFLQFLIDITLLTIVIYFVGTVEWISPVFYVFTIIYTGFVIPEASRRFILNAYAIILFAGLCFLQYFNILSYHGLLEPFGHYRNLGFLISTLILTASTFILIAITINIFGGRLSRKSRELEQANQALKYSRHNLENLVKARTSKLEDLRDKLEQDVASRTKQLQKKVSELERFNRLAIGREMRIIELKEEVKKLKDQSSLRKKKKVCLMLTN